MNVLKKRSDFLKAARAAKVAMPGFILQMRNRPGQSGVRVGFTCSKKVGNAVERNRAKRRLREVARLTLLPDARDGADYVLIGRAAVTASLPFDRLQKDMQTALGRLHQSVK